MSGGDLNYIYYQIGYEAETLESRLKTEEDPFVKIALFRVAKEMQKCSKLAKEAELYLSGDIMSDTFLSRVEKIFEGS